MSGHYVLKVIVFAAMLLAGSGIGAPVSADPDVFPNPPGLQNAVAFWQKVFGVWRGNQVVLHDNEHLDIVYEVIDLSGTVGEGLTPGQKAYVEYRRGALADRLRDLERYFRTAMPLGAEDRRVLDLFAKSGDPYAIVGASRRVRSQKGMRDRFIQGVVTSGQFEKRIRQVFSDGGLPEDLALLPHVESSFVNRAHSSAGAAGVWQFMPGTGARYLTMNHAVDERFDPVFAARGAARYLGNAHRQLGDWGLAITSYNHGVGGMIRAKREIGPDIDRIVRHYRGPRFGFASRNFYPEFLAVRSLLRNIDGYIPGGIRVRPPMDTEYVRLTRGASLRQLANAYGVYPHVLEYLNPALTPRAVRGQVPLPAGTDIWIPRDRLVHLAGVVPYAERHTRFSLAKPHIVALREHVQPANRKVVSRVASSSKKATRPRAGKTHIVRRGETPHRIASKYGVRVREMLALNSLDANSLIRPGQQLRIPAKR